MKIINNIFLLVTIFIILSSCKNESGSSASAVSSAPAAVKGGDISSLAVLDHDFNILPEGSKLFVKGFFNNQLINSAITVDKGKLHVKEGILSTAEFGLNMNSIAMIMERNESLESFLKSDKAFNVQKNPNGVFKIDECVKAVNDQHATHNIKGSLTLNGKTIPITSRARIDYTSGNITILSDQIIIKCADLGIKPEDASQENIYFSLTLNGALPK